MRRGPTIYLRLSHGRLEAGPGGGPASCCLEISPFMGRHRQPTGHNMGQRRPAALAAETDGSAKYGAADGPPFPSPEASGASNSRGSSVPMWPSRFVQMCTTSRQDCMRLTQPARRWGVLGGPYAPHLQPWEARSCRLATLSLRGERQRRSLFGPLCACCRDTCALANSWSPRPDALTGWSAPQGRPPHLVQRLTCTAAPYERRGHVRRLEEPAEPPPARRGPCRPGRRASGPRRPTAIAAEPSRRLAELPAITSTEPHEHRPRVERSGSVWWPPKALLHWRCVVIPDFPALSPSASTNRTGMSNCLQWTAALYAARRIVLTWRFQMTVLQRAKPACSI